MTDQQQPIRVELPAPEPTELDRVLETAMALKPIERLQLIQRLTQSLTMHITEAPVPRKSLYGILEGQGKDLSLEDFQQARRELTQQLLEQLGRVES